MVRFCLMVFLLVLSQSANALTLDDLVQQQKLHIEAWLEKVETLAEGEEQLLNIAVTTEAEFAGAIRINRFEIDNVIVLAQGKSAHLESRVARGNKQHWQIKMYPLESGEYVVPPVTVEVALADGEQSISGKLIIQPLAFAVNKPSAYMTDEQHWLSATDVELEQNWNVIKLSKTIQDHETDTESGSTLEVYHVGDAIEREVTLTAYHSASMLFPTLLAQQDYDVNGIKAYVEQDSYFDIDEQEGSFGEHIEKVTIMVTKPGEIVIPDIQLYWWDTQREQLTTLTLEGKVISVEHTVSSWISAYWVWLILAVIANIAMLAVIPKQRRRLNQREKQGRIALWCLFYRALLAKQWPHAEWLLYKKNQAKTGRLSLEATAQNQKYAKAWHADRNQLQQVRYSKQTQEKQRHNLGLLLFKLWRKNPTESH